MTTSPLSLPAVHWPEIDRKLWLAAKAPPDFLEDDKPASHWGRARRRICEQAYGQWLAYLKRNATLDPTSTPGERATDARLQAFVAELQGRVSPASAAMMVGALLRMLAVLAPQGDWRTLARAYSHLKRTAVPSRNKLARMVPATALFELGLRLMETCEDGPTTRVYRATKYRDGLLVALLIACPMRLKNFAGLVIGQHLVFDGLGYLVKLAASETKTGRPYVAGVPAELTAYMDRWLNVYRAYLQLIANAALGSGIGGHLWLDRHGRPMSSKAVRAQLEARTKEAFGKHIWPHLFRDCAVTELVDSAPEEIGIAPDLLGHANLGTTKKHYIHAVGMQAHARVQEVIAARRRAATSRDSTGASGA